MLFRLTFFPLLCHGDEVNILYPMMFVLPKYHLRPALINGTYLCNMQLILLGNKGNHPFRSFL